MIYFIAIGVHPFGNNTIMTVDLGQQYIDFFGLFHDTLLHHPSSFFYSFSKDIGGDMLGVWSYYLLSPLNLIFLFFSKENLDVAVLIITLLKYGLMSSSFYYFGSKTTKVSKKILIPVSISYSLSGFFIANQFNLMWLDAGYLLPLIALGIFKIFQKGKINLYVFTLAAILIINYYMGYMICIFAVLYFIYLSTINYHTFKELLNKTVKFFIGSLISGLLAAMILLPTFFQLTQSKGSYTIKQIHWKFEYSPLKMITKFNIGAYNFDAISSGYPNIFIPSLILAVAILYFFIKKIPLRCRFSALLITLFMIFSMCFEPLDLLWHGFQFPVWYPYRFSYIFIFWLLILGLNSFEYIKEIKINQLIIPSILFITITYASLFYRTKISYLNYIIISLTAIFFIISITLLGGIINQYPILKKITPFLIIFEVIVNAYVSLSRIGFISHSEYARYVKSSEHTLNKIKNKDHDFYRIGKSFERTNNDAMLLDFNGTDQFNSMLEPKTSNLYAQLGQPQSEGDVIYGNGNVFTDSFLGIKYFLNSNSHNKNVFKPIGTRSDIQNYGNFFNDHEISIKENPYVLTNGFLVSDKVLKTDLALINPIMNYNSIYNSFSSNKNYQDLFLPFYSYTEKLINLKEKRTNSFDTYTKINRLKPAKIIISLTPKTNDPYYVSLNGDLSDNKVKYSVNGKVIEQDQTIQNTIVQSIFQNQKNKVVNYELDINANKINLYDLSFYFMDTTKFLIQNNHLQNSQLKIINHTSNKIIGNIDVKQKKENTLFYSIPYAKGWNAFVDGKKVRINKAFKNFIAIKLSTGKHSIKIEYIPLFLA
ncbi:membrane protein [Xylocopilactobacillus apis]|uniref:Membrane protein n=2 Tax=Xylocopilactobacillus apis TaxID=2932183 RepID=A0AAU9DRZ2_9LACO|nr:membrane protein [Xylocopilactobacillus apis]